MSNQMIKKKYFDILNGAIYDKRNERDSVTARLDEAATIKTDEGDKQQFVEKTWYEIHYSFNLYYK